MNNEVREFIAALQRVADKHPQIEGNETRLAELAGTTQATVNRIFSGETKDPQISSIIGIAKACGVRLWEMDSWSPQSVNTALLSEILTMIEEELIKIKRTCPPSKKAEIASYIYERHVGQVDRPARYHADVIRLVKMVA